MKYIIYWTFLAYHSVPCPCQKQYDSIYGVGYSCAVAHFESNPVDTSIFYYNRKSAFRFYKQKMIQYWKQEVTVMDGMTGEESCRMLRLPGFIENIRVDSVCVFKGLYY